jgi:hypothetical protein
VHVSRLFAFAAILCSSLWRATHIPSFAAHHFMKQILYQFKKQQSFSSRILWNTHSVMNHFEEVNLVSNVFSAGKENEVY